MKTIEQQTGWKRPFPQMLCQDIDVLRKVRTFTFDHKNKEFLKYFVARTGDNVLYEKFSIDVFMESTKEWDLITKAKMQDCWELYKG